MSTRPRFEVAARARLPGIVQGRWGPWGAGRQARRGPSCVGSSALPPRSVRGPRAQYAPFAPLCAASAHNTGMRAPHFARVPIVCQVTKFSGTRRQFRKGPEHSRRASIRFSGPLDLKPRDRDRQGVPPAHPSHVLGRDGWRRADRYNAEVRTLGLPMRSCSARDLHRSMLEGSTHSARAR